MKLTTDREQTVLKAYTTYWTSLPYPRKERTPKQAFIACAEWMQDEIDVWCAKLKAHEKLERDARFENAKLLKVIEVGKKAALDRMQYVQDKSDGSAFMDDTLPVWFGLIAEAMDKAMTNAGLDQREDGKA